MSDVCAKNIGAETKMGAVKRNYRDHSQGDQECGTVQQVAPSADLISATEKSQN